MLAPTIIEIEDQRRLVELNPISPAAQGAAESRHRPAEERAVATADRASRLALAELEIGKRAEETGLV